jgi:hypothetical protein
MNQTQGWWHQTTKKHGYKTRQIITLGRFFANFRNAFG